MNKCEQQHINLLTQQMQQVELPVVQPFDIDKSVSRTFYFSRHCLIIASNIQIYHPGIALHASTNHHRIIYNALVNHCVNQEMNNEYGLESYSEIEYCSTKDTENFSIDALDWFCLVVVTSLLALIVIGSLYDAQLRSKGGNNPEHFRKFPMNCKCDDILQQLNRPDIKGHHC